MKGLVCNMRKVLIWDFDGTLVHANMSFFDVLSELLEKRGCGIGEDGVKAFLRRTSTWFMPERAYTDRTGEKWWAYYYDALRLFCREHGIDDAEVLCREFYDGVNGYEYTVYPDAEETLAYFHARGYENYVLSNNFPELPRVIERLGLGKYFRDYFISTNIGYEKPRGELYEYVKTQIGECGFCCMIGDSLESDIRAAKNAGVTAALVHNGKADEADFCCDSLGEMRKYF